MGDVAWITVQLKSNIFVMNESVRIRMFYDGGPAQGNLITNGRITDANGDFIDQQLRSVEKP